MKQITNNSNIIFGIWILIILFFSVVVTDKLQAQENADYSEKTECTKEPISLYRDNYLLFGWNNSSLNNGAVFKSQISGKLRALIPGLFIGYTQRSFMDLAAASVPFYDHNFAPEIFYILPVSEEFSKKYLLNMLKLAVIHESNGRSGTDSRSWNRVYLETLFRYKGFSFRPIVWIPFLKDDPNKDIEKYYGYGEFILSYEWANHTELSLAGRLGTKFGNGNIKADLSVPLKTSPVLNSTTSFWLQIWHGHGESLLGFSESATAIAAGVGFRP